MCRTVMVAGTSTAPPSQRQAHLVLLVRKATQAIRDLPVHKDPRVTQATLVLLARRVRKVILVRQVLRVQLDRLDSRGPLDRTVQSVSKALQAPRVRPVRPAIQDQRDLKVPRVIPATLVLRE
jgi:hypothetical protein